MGDGGKKPYSAPTIRPLTRDQLTEAQRAWCDDVALEASGDVGRSALGAGPHGRDGDLCDLAAPQDAAVTTFKRHALCDRCWSDFAPGRQAVRVRDCIDNCCKCGHKTKSGIYVRVAREQPNEAFAIAWPNCRCRP